MKSHEVLAQLIQWECYIDLYFIRIKNSLYL